jgi:Family of unknown function (DUF5309)
MAISTTYQPTPAVTTSATGSAVGNREDLSDVLTMLEPRSAPVMAMIPKIKIEALMYNWVIDGLKAPSTEGIGETEDIGSYEDKFAARGRLSNNVQIRRSPYAVSTLQQAVKSVGPADVARAQAKCQLEIRRDFEAIILSSNDKSLEDGVGNLHKCRGLGNWLSPTGPSDVPEPYRTPEASVLTQAVTPEGISNVMASIYEQSNESGNLTLVANIALRKAMSKFSMSSSGITDAIYRVNQDSSTKSITLSVSMFDTDFGLLKVVNGNSACMPTENTHVGFLLDPKQLAFGSLLPLGFTPGVNSGGGERGFYEMAGTLIVRSPQAHGRIAYDA